MSFTVRASRPAHELPSDRRANSAEGLSAVLWLSSRARERLAFCAAGSMMIVAGGLTAAISDAVPFTHAAWLAAYLVLVGGVAQMILGLGWLALPQATVSARQRDAQLVLWNSGTLAVAAGVLSDLTGVVLLGSIVFVCGLASFARGSGPVGGARRRWVLSYRIFIWLLVISVIVGGVLARTWSAPANEHPSPNPRPAPRSAAPNGLPAAARRPAHLAPTRNPHPHTLTQRTGANHSPGAHVFPVLSVGGRAPEGESAQDGRLLSASRTLRAHPNGRVGTFGLTEREVYGRARSPRTSRVMRLAAKLLHWRSISALPDGAP